MTEGWTDGQTDKAGCRVALHATKNIFECLFVHPSIGPTDFLLPLNLQGYILRYDGSRKTGSPGEIKQSHTSSLSRIHLKSESAGKYEDRACF